MSTKQAQNLEESYYQITTIYDMADTLITDVVNTPKDQQEAHFRLVNPLVERLEASADILTEEFINIAEGKDNIPAAPADSRVETALRKIYAAMDDFQKRASILGNQSTDALLAKVQPMVDGIKQHVEKVIGIFVDFLNLALDRIMQKADLESLRQRNEKIAAIMHNLSMAHGKAT